MILINESLIYLFFLSSFTIKLLFICFIFQFLGNFNHVNNPIRLVFRMAKKVDLEILLKPLIANYARTNNTAAFRCKSSGSRLEFVRNGGKATENTI
jgi:hypothetical protein